MKRISILIVFMLVNYLLFSTNATRSESDTSSVNTKEQGQSIDMVYVEGGTLTMGDTTTGEGIVYKKHTRQVTVSSFYLGKYEVTQKQWVEVMGYNLSHWKGDDLPVEGVSSYECLEFCNKLSLKEGLTPCYSGERSMTECDWTANGYRLPTEAEWQFASKGGNLSNDYDYSGSNNLDDVAWYKKNSGKKTHQIGQKQPNELGFYDMSGNVKEWCWDWMGAAEYYSTKPAVNPKGEDAGIYRVQRGASWSSKLKECLVEERDSFWPDVRYSRNSGFRVCRNK
jgi:formylglycine-generating enzyme required for sulfatase activity